MSERTLEGSASRVRVTSSDDSRVIGMRALEVRH